MNILRLVSIGMTVAGLTAAMPAFANAPNIAHYGAGFLPSPTLEGTITIPTNNTVNYGAGFVGSPTLIGGTSNSTIHAAYYGAGFAGSPNMIYANRGPRYGFYGAGFLNSPRIIYGFNWFNW